MKTKAIMAGGRSTTISWILAFLLILELIAPTHSHPSPIKSPVLSSSTPSTTASAPSSELTLAGKNPAKEIEPPEPKFKTTPDPDLPPELNLNVMAKENLSFYDDEHMVLTTTRYMPGMYQVRMPIGNGYFGSSLAAAGPFYEKDVNQTNHDGNVTEGWPLFNDRQTFATISGFWDSQVNTTRANYYELQKLGWESVISGIPFPLAFNLVVGDHVLNSTVDRKTISDFTATWRLQDGITQWSYLWSPNNTNMAFDVQHTAFMSRDNPNGGAVELQVTPRGGNYNASIIDLLDGRSAQRSRLVEKGMLAETQIFVGVHPEGLPNVTAFIVSTAEVSNGYTVESSRRMVTTTGYKNENNMTIGQEWDVQLIDGETAVFQKFIGVASSDKFEQPRVCATASSTTSAQNGWDATISEHTHAWNNLMKRNLITDYRDPSTGKLPVNDRNIQNLRIEAVIDRYITLINLLPENGSGLNDVGISPTGMSADSYGGMVFWDQDQWIAPNIAAMNPEYAVQILNSRVKFWEQAKTNTQMDYVKQNYTFDHNSVLYPWTSGRYGNATATGPALNYQYHLNTDIALSMLQFLRITGNESHFQQKFWPVIKSVGHTIATLLQKDGNGWSILNLTDPDEYAAGVDNGAYTLSSFSYILHQIIALQRKYGEGLNQTWIDMANNVNIPRAASGITQEYFPMPNNITVKQADIALMSYPWHYTGQNYTLENKRMDLAYYNQKQNPDGPAMTFAINAIVENQIAASGCAASTYHHKATTPYLRAPWFLMSEVPNDDVNGNGGVPPAFPFVTGHGGAAQIPLFGYLGLNLNQENLTIQPSLAPPISHLQPPDFYFQGAKFRAAMNSTHTNLTRLPSKNITVIVDVYAGRPMPVVIGSPEGRRKQEFYTIVVDQTLTIDNDMYWKIATTKGNIAQCQATTSQSESVLGQWPGAATDGNPATRWQPLTVNPTNITTDISHVPFQRVTQINFDWGARPPLKVKVGFTNSSDVKSFNDRRMRTVNLGDIQANVPYRILNETEPVPYVGNTTQYEIKLRRGRKPVYTGKYAWLQIEGCNQCGAMNSWTGGNGTMFNPQENTFGATVGEFEIIGALGVNVLG